MKKLILIAVMFCFTCVAEAKITYNNSALNDLHINTIKGLLYDIAHSEGVVRRHTPNKEQIQKLLPQFSKAIVWLIKYHNSSTTYKLENMSNEEAKLIKGVVATITDVIQGKYPGLLVEKALDHWTKIGSRLIAEYKVNSNNTTSKITWKFELKPEKDKTQNLVFRYGPAPKEINQQ